MSYRLLVRAADTGGPERAFDLDEPVVRVGRGDGCEVRLPQREIANVACRIERAGERVEVVAVGGPDTAPIEVGGAALDRGERRAFDDGDVLSVGRFQLTFRTTSPSHASPTGRAAAVALARELAGELLQADNPGAPHAPHLLGVRGIASGAQIRLDDTDRIIVGRTPPCEVVLDDKDLSRQHFALARMWAGVTVTDLGSKNGTFVDRRRISGPTALVDGTKVQAGGCGFRFVDPPGRLLRELDEAETAAARASPPSRHAPEAGSHEAPVDTDARRAVVAAVIGVVLALAVGALIYLLAG